LNSNLEAEVVQRTSELRKVNSDLKSELKKHKLSQQQLSKALIEYRKLYTYIQSVREEERVNIARSIHDNLAQLLATLKIELTSSRAKTDKLDFLLQDSYDTQLLLVDQCMNAVNEVIMEIRPVLLDKMGLVPALKKLLSDFQKNVGISCDTRIKENSHPVKGEIATAIYRVVKEVIVNIRNHSKANYVMTIIQTNSSYVSIIIQDNGIGISKEQISDSGSFGIKGMRERIDQLKGKIIIKGTVGKGTTVRIKVPVKKLLR
jgi:signal transduction histidine kinase